MNIDLHKLGTLFMTDTWMEEAVPKPALAA